MAKSVRLSEKHGVNPSVLTCFVCGDSYGIALLGRLPGDAEAPREMTHEKQWCDSCRTLADENDGVWLVRVRDGEKGRIPYRLGQVTMMRAEAVRRVIHRPEGLADEIIRRRMAFVPDAAWVMLGIDERIEADDVPTVPGKGGKR